MPNNTDTVPLRSEEVQELLTAVPVWMIRWGNTLIFFLIFGVFGITFFVRYSDIISAEAMITTQLPPQKEFAKTSGQVDTFLVADNQIVKANTPLAIIENTANFEDVFLLKSIIDTIMPYNNHIEFPSVQIPLLFLGDIASDFALFENSYSQYVLNKKWQPFSNEAFANRQSLSALNIRLENLKNQQELNASELEIKKRGLERSKMLFEQGVISAEQYENKQLEILQANQSFKNRKNAISQANESISNAKLLAKNTSMNHSKEEQLLFRNVIQSFQQLKKAIKEWELKYVLKSNIDGKVSFLDYWTENQNISAGDLVFIIIPQKNKDYLAKLKAPNLNSGKLKIGQNVNIKLKNYPETEYGTLKGSIEKISLMMDKDGFYLVDVSLPSKLITSYEKEITFKQEMEGTAEIVTEELRLIERFFYQLKGIFSR